MKMAPGDCFVQRNVGNLVNVKDLNCMCCLEYSVDHLKVQHVLVCGHYNCGAPLPGFASFFDCMITTLLTCMTQIIHDLQKWGQPWYT